MPKTRAGLAFLAVALLMPACSLEISSNTPATPPAVTSAPQTPTGAQANPGTATAQAGVTQMPITWSELHLTGRLVYTTGVRINKNAYSIQVASLDLATGVVTPIFQTPNTGWIDSAAVSPGGKELVIAFAPPVGEPGQGQQTLYSLPADGSRYPQLLFKPHDINDQNQQVVWSPDGKYVYFAHLNYSSSDPMSVWRAAYPSGQTEKLVDNGYWPRLSVDSSRLTYVGFDLGTGSNLLFVANADGTQPRQVPVPNTYMTAVIDVPMFSPDGENILFSAPDPPQSSIFTGIDTLLTAIQVHAADGYIPSDWWSVPVAGGTPTQLTHLAALSLFGTFSPDKRYVASYSINGIFVMNPDGTGVTMVVPDVGGLPGTVAWIP